MFEGFGVRIVCAAVAFVSAPSVHALSFGSEQVQSSLGQPLRMTIPLLGATGDSLEARCFRVVAPTRVDGLTVVTQARIDVQTTSTPPQLLIRGVRSLDEPVVRITLEAGCDTPIRRDYTLLLDPPPLQPSAAMAPPPVTPPSAESTQRVSGVANADGRTTSAPDVATTAGDSGKAKRTASDRTRSARKTSTTEKQAPDRARTSVRAKVEPASNGGPDQLQVQGGLASGGTPVEDASLAALAVPRLKVSSDLPVFDPGAISQPGGGDELQAAIAKERRARLLASPIEEDLAPRLEADFVVAKRRLAELQAQLSAAGVGATQPGSVTAPGKALAEQTTGTTDWLRWLWVLPALLLVVGLVAFLRRQRREQQAQPQFNDIAAVTAEQAADNEFDTVMPTRTMTRATVPALTPSEPPTVDHQAFDVALASAVAASPAVATADATSASSLVRAGMDPSDRLNHPIFGLEDTAPHLDVTELSQVTDEAQVYADLDHNDQAIELLRQHIDSSQSNERSSPAPWLMIFDLYRRTNNRAGYDELAPQFRRHFNGRMPDWDNYGHELALDDGLEAFPHLVARIERDWGTPDARKFLEELLYDNRGGSRLGFSLAAYRDILLLLQIHEGLGLTTSSTHSATDWEARGADGNDGTPKWDLELDVIEPPQSGELDSFLKNLPPPDKT